MANDINTKDGSNFSPEYHDFALTVDALAYVVEFGDKGTALDRLRKIVQEKKFRHGTQVYFLHPDIVKYLEGILEAE